MIRLHIIAEGQTEAKFITSLLVPYLAKNNIFVDVHCITNKYDRKHNKYYRGGLLDYSKLRKDLQLWIKQEENNQNCWITTMVDLYAFPTTNSPYNEKIQSITDKYIKIEQLEKEFFNDLGFSRFIPYIQLHEFETFIFCNLNLLSELFINKKREIQQLINSVSTIDNPELINEGRESAPSKRLIKFISEYEEQKTTAGPLICEEIGIDHLRRKCKHFNAWITKLIELNKTDSKPLL